MDPDGGTPRFRPPPKVFRDEATWPAQTHSRLYYMYSMHHVIRACDNCRNTRVDYYLARVAPESQHLWQFPQTADVAKLHDLDDVFPAASNKVGVTFPC